MQHETTVQVRFSEMDPYGHVNHVVFLAYLEQGRVDLLDSLGWGLDRMRKHGLGVIVVEAQIKYRSPAMYGDLLTVTTEIETMRGLSSWWSQEIWRDDTLICTARIRGATVDLDGGPTRPPAELRGALEPYVADG